MASGSLCLHTGTECRRAIAAPACRRSDEWPTLRHLYCQDSRSYMSRGRQHHTLGPQGTLPRPAHHRGIRLHLPDPRPPADARLTDRQGPSERRPLRHLRVEPAKGRRLGVAIAHGAIQNAAAKARRYCDGFQSTPKVCDSCAMSGGTRDGDTTRSSLAWRSPDAKLPPPPVPD
jgi:hypothetical protein